MNALAERRSWTPEEYLAFERESPEKHEYFDGEIFAMAGSNRQHDRIATTLMAVLVQRLGAGPCEPFSSDMRIHIPANGKFTYSDGLIACGAEFQDNAVDTLLNPCVIFEVLSSSTESYDRGQKFEHYRSIPALRDYVLVSQDEVLVEHFVRQPDGAWKMTEVRSGQSLTLSALPLIIPVDALYVRVLGN